MIRWTDLNLPGLKARLCQMQRGDTMEFLSPPGRTRGNSIHFTIEASGTATEVWENDVPGDRNVVAGTTNAAVLRWPSGVGRVVRTVTSDEFSYYCLSDAHGRLMNVTEMKRRAGSIVAVPVGFCLFVGIGSVEVGDQTIPAPGFIESKNQVASVRAATDIVALLIQRLPQP